MYFSALELNVKDTVGGGLAKQSLLVLEHLPVRRSVVFETKCGKKQEASGIFWPSADFKLDARQLTKVTTA